MPYEHMIRNILSIINEIMLIAVLCVFYLIRTIDPAEDSRRIKNCWIAVFILAGNLAV